METELKTKQLKEFQNDLLKRPECIIGGVGGNGDIDKDKSTIPGQGI